MAPSLDDDDDAAYDIDVDALVEKHMADSRAAAAAPYGPSSLQPSSAAPHVQPWGASDQRGRTAPGRGAPAGHMASAACQGVMSQTGGQGQGACQQQQQLQRSALHAQPLQQSNYGPQVGPVQHTAGPQGSCHGTHGAVYGRGPLLSTSIALPPSAQERFRPPAAAPAPHTSRSLMQPGPCAVQGSGYGQAVGVPHVRHPPQPAQGPSKVGQQNGCGDVQFLQPQLHQRAQQPVGAAQVLGTSAAAPQAHAAMAPQNANNPQARDPCRQLQGQVPQQRPQCGAQQPGQPPQREMLPQHEQHGQPWLLQHPQHVQPQMPLPEHTQQQPAQRPQHPLQRQWQHPPQPQPPDQAQRQHEGQPRLQQKQPVQPPPILLQQPLRPQQQLHPSPQQHPQRPPPPPPQLHEQHGQVGEHPHPLQRMRVQQQQPPPAQPPQPNGQVAPYARNTGSGPSVLSNGGPQPPNRPVNFTASLALEDKQRFAVKVGYHDGLKAVFSLISGAVYDPIVKGWTFPLIQYNHVMDALTDGRLRTRGVNITMQETFPDFVKGILKAAASRSNDEHLYDKLLRRPNKAEQSLDERMMPFQREGVRHALRLGGRVLIGDEMGLGKTVQACCLLYCYSEEWPALVVVPKSLRDTWADALFTWLKLTDAEVLVVHNAKDADQLGSLKPKIAVVSYDSLMRIADQLKAIKFRMVVLDEAHYIKNTKAQRTKEALPLLQQAKRVVLLTGTPALSKPMELVPLLQALMPSAGIKATAFGERYSIQDRRYPSKFYGTRNEGELNKLLQGTIMVRRLKKDVLRDLPTKRRQQVFIRLPDKDMRKMDSLGRELEGIRALMKSLDAAGGSGLQGIANEKQQAIMQLWHATAALKAEAVAEYCADLLAEGQDAPKFLIFAHHQVLLDTVEKQVKDCKAKYIRIDGSTSSEARAESVKRFQEDEAVKVAILSIKAAGVGLTMTASSLVVFAELSWVPGDIQQAEDRCHRIGQSSSVNVHFLLVRKSIDEIMWDTVQNKLGAVGKVLDGSGASIKVDATRELRGYGAGGMAGRPGQGEEDGEGRQNRVAEACTAHDGGTTVSGAIGASSGVATVSLGSGVSRGGSRRSPAPAAAGTRHISDYFAPAVGAGNRGSKRARG